MNQRTQSLLALLWLSILVSVLILTGTILLNPSSIIRLPANPQGDATACLHHPSQATCSETVSPFGTGQPGAASCARDASLPAVVALSDPSMNEAPIATLQLWHSSACHASFASASTLLGFLSPSTFTVTLKRQVNWWQSTLRETQVQNTTRNQIVRTWTPLLYSDLPTGQPTEACLSITGTKSYHVCTTSLL